MIEARPLGPWEFCKYHALGNDYLVIDGSTFGGDITAAAMAALCHRHTGIGSDGVLVLGPGDAHSTATLRIFNPDGSEAEKSGNGLRIFGRALFDLGYSSQSELTVRLQGALVPLRLLLASSAQEAPRAEVETIAVQMGTPLLHSAAVHMTGSPRPTVHCALQVLGETLDVSAVSMGNPHCVTFVETLSPTALRRLGPAIERHVAFTQRTNVQLARVVDASHIELLIWERGAGETSASGSSSCAAVAAAQARGLCGDAVEVRSPGGTLLVQRQKDGALLLTGPAEPICRGTFIPPRR